MQKHFLTLVVITVFASVAIRLWIENAAVTARKVGLPA
jgi:hypothetical protein